MLEGQVLGENGRAAATDVNEITSRDITVLRREGAQRREPSGHQKKGLQRRLRGLLRVGEAQEDGITEAKGKGLKGRVPGIHDCITN